MDDSIIPINVSDMIIFRTSKPLGGPSKLLSLVVLLSIKNITKFCPCQRINDNVINGNNVGFEQCIIARRTFQPCTT